MLQSQLYPILEFDSNPTAIIEPSILSTNPDMPQCCVMTFFRDVIDAKLKQGLLKQIAMLHSESVDIPVYVINVGDTQVGLVHADLGAPACAGQLEELIALGGKRFIVCGGAGVLQKDIAVGHLILPISAVRDEGTSYHYLPPAREVACSADALELIQSVLDEKQIAYIKAKTWTTDAFYRETRDKVNLRISEGCVTVEMEAAALFAVAQFRGVSLGQILYGGDDLSGAQWDGRKWKNRTDIRLNLVDCCLEISARHHA